MKSIRYTRPGYGLYDVPEPQIENADDVKIKVAYASICGSDVHTIRGDMDEYFNFTPGEPNPLGHEASGVVVELGPEANVKGLNVGDKVAYYYNVYCGKCYFCRNGQEQFCLNVKNNGTAMSEFMVLREQQVFKLPDDTDLARGCLVEPVSVCLHGIDMCHIRVGNKVAISGGGGIGLILLQLARLSGASKLTLIEPVAEKRELAMKLGSDYTIDPVQQDVVEEAMKITDHLGYDVVIESSGVPAACQPAYDILSRGGVLEFFAIYANYKFPLDLMDLWDREATICGVFQSPYMFLRAIATLNRLDLDQFVKHIYKPEDCVEAFEAQMTGKPVKVMFKFS
ncbi:MAG: alcohol dehydrogenase catalytic domain-containing protein [Bacillota bacterium]|nr:alcohol dehydrogenase catalytic domain-containing protein [Bacillota bacterium]